MTIETAAVRCQFGQSVRAWPTDAKPPQTIIAKLFRDVGQTDDGLTRAVEEVAGAVMRRLTRQEGNRATDGNTLRTMTHRNGSGFDQLRRERVETLLHRLYSGPMTRVECLDLLGMSDGPYWTRIMQTLEQGHLATITKASNRTTLTITPAGRAHVAGKMTAE